MFSTLNAGSWYWQKKIDRCNREKTAFKSDHRRDRLARMQFRLENARTAFQRRIDVIRTSVRCSIVLVYLNDVIVSSESPADDIEQI